MSDMVTGNAIHLPTQKTMEDLKPSHTPKVNQLEGVNDLKVYYCGPDLSEGPLPAFIYFALAGDESLGLDPYNQPVAFLAEAPLRIFSFTLPFHGADFVNKKAMTHWAQAFKSGHDFIQEFIHKVKENIDFLEKSNYLDSKSIAVGGLSRGGLVAFYLVASDPRIKTLVSFAPLTFLPELEEFNVIGENSLVKKYNILNIIDLLFNKQIHIFIGNRDIRVGTDNCYQLVQALTLKAYENGIRSPQIELSIRPSIGHKGHGTSPKTFFDGANWLRQKLLIEN